MIQASEDTKLQILKRVIGFKMEPPTIDEFLDSDYYLGSLGLMVYPFWRKKLRELFPNNITSTSTYVCLYGCIGGGKSFFSQLVLLYDVVKVACCEDFFKFNDITLTKGIYIKCSNTWKNKAQDAVNFLNDVVFGGKVPFFENELRKGNKFLTNLKFKAVGTRESDLRSDDVLCFWLSELTAMKTAVGQNLISSSDSRLTSRFISSERLFTHIILDSSTTGVDSALDLFLRNDPKAEKAFKVHVNSWNTTEGLGKYFNFGSFEVYAGDSQRNPFIIPKNFSEHERSQLDKDRIIVCPNELIEEAKRNIVLFLQEKAGISTNTSSKFFLDRQKVEQAFCLSKSYDDSLALRFFDPLDTLMSKLKDTVSTLPQDRKLYIRIDCGVANDLFGICVAYGDGVKRVNVDGIPTERLRIKIPIALGISRYEGEETNISKVEDFILQLNQDYEVALVLTDQYQSTSLRQTMKQNGIKAELASVDRDDNAYVITKNYIYQDLVEIADNRIALKEMLELERVGPKKVDHPAKELGGSKDIADSISGVIARMVELGPEEVLAPPAGRALQDLENTYSQLNSYRSNQFSTYSTYSDYL